MTNKIKKTKILDFLPVVALVFWATINISTALFYTLQYYHLANLLVNIVGAILFWASIKYNNKHLENKYKEKT